MDPLLVANSPFDGRALFVFTVGREMSLRWLYSVNDSTDMATQMGLALCASVLHRPPPTTVSSHQITKIYEVSTATRAERTGRHARVYSTAHKPPD